MKIWLDTTNLDTIRQASNLGILYGVTTNPALISQSQLSLKEVLQSLLEQQEGPITGQVLAADIQGMVEQGNALYNLSDRIIVKIPVSEQGLEAINILSKQGICVMATIVLHPHQALLAAIAGARYVAPYVSHIEQLGSNPWGDLESMQKTFNHYAFPTEILAASLRSVAHVQKCAEMGIPHVTIKDKLFQELIATTAPTQERIDHFAIFCEKSKQYPFL